MPSPPAAGMQAAGGFRLNAFGLEVDADRRIPGARAAGSTASPARLSLRLVAQDDLLALCEEPRILRLLHLFDGCPYAMLEGGAGDTLMCYGHRALFHLSGDRHLLRCAPTDYDDPHWQRVLLDTVLWTVSALEGFQLLHASAVGTSRGVVAFLAGSGGGKTSLAAEYLRRGASLFSDDIVALDERNGEVVAFPGPPLMNLPHGLALSDLGKGRTIADFGDERWVELHSDPPAPQPLAVVVLVERAAGEETCCRPIDGTTLELLPHTLGFTQPPELARARFDLVGTLAATTPLLKLTAEPSVPTGVLADLIDDRMGVA